MNHPNEQKLNQSTAQQDVRWHSDVPPLPPQQQPPILAQLWLEWVLPPALQDPILGDLQEEFVVRQQQHRRLARHWYVRQSIQTGLQFIQQTKGDLLMFMLSVLFFLAITGFGIWLCNPDNPAIFYDFPSILLVVVPAPLLAVGVTSRQIARQAISLLTQPAQAASARDYQQSLQFWRVLGNTAVLCGIVATLVGIIAIANSTNGDNAGSVLGPASAVCLLTMLYAFILKTLSYVASEKIRYLALGCHFEQNDE